MVALRTRMRLHLWKWQEDLPPGSGWPAFFADCPRPAFHDCAFRDHPITGSDNIRSVIPI